MEATLVEKSQELPDAWSFTFSKPPGFHFDAGDYTEIEVYRPGFAGRRWFSIATAPHEDNLQFIIKYPPEPSEFKQELLKLTPGSTVHLSPAIGNFNLPLKDEKLLFVAGGIGITPYISMLKHMDFAGLKRDIRLIHTARGNHLFGSFSQQHAATSLHDSRKKRLDFQEITGLVPDFATRIVYLAGPEPMMSELHEQFLSAGHPRPRLKLEYFTGYDRL